MYSIGQHVWIRRDAAKEGLDALKGCRIVKIDRKNVQVEDDYGNIEWITADRVLRAMHGSEVEAVDDMIDLGDLQDHAILRNLRMRYERRLIYTYIGDMLITVNPYQVLNIYSPSLVSTYSEINKLENLPPHVFATGSRCFADMRSTGQDQCILISGESGAGKTESTKLILQYLTTISAGGRSWIKQQILEANPILEAFGNAKTEMNDNSSRFGKYINVHFNELREIEGAQIDYYLLEKSRIVTHAKNERSYHVFYSLFAGLSDEERQRLNLTKPSDYKYLQGVTTCKGRNDRQTFANVKAAMQILKYDEQTFPQIVRLLATILHLGNLKYRPITIAHADATEVQVDVWLKKVCELLGLSKQALADFLTKRRIFVHGDKVVRNLSLDQAHEVRDSFAKAIYERIFEKLLEGINRTIHNSKRRPKNTIGILDISGFENFSSNSFEQLCINYTNEHLQQFFVQHIFKIEQENYASEGIIWREVDFVDNQEIIDLIGAKPLNVMSLIDEESIFPKGSDASLISKLALIHANNAHFEKPRSGSPKEFGIVHYAGVVRYEVTGFLAKNRDHLSGDLGQLVAASSNAFFKKLFSKADLATAFDNNNNNNNNNDLNGKKSATLSTKFRESLDSLLNTLGMCNPFFIRCIKPNESQLPQVFDEALCYRQLRYLGLLDTARIRKAGYPQRYEYGEFVERFFVLARGIVQSRKIDRKFVTEKICARVLDPRNERDCQFGSTKVFLKEHQNAILEREAEKALRKYALVLQKNLRMWTERSRFLRMRRAAMVVQKNWRTYRSRKNYLSFREAISRLQSRIRSRRHEIEFQKKRKIIVSFQAACRRYLVRKYCNEKRKQLKVKKIQARQSRDQATGSSVHSTYESESSSIDATFDFLDSELISLRPRKISSEIQADLIGKDVIRPPSEISDADVISYDFHKFATIYFTGSVTSHHAKNPLKHSLLDLPHVSDQLAAKALSVMIFRFMGDLPEPENHTDHQRKTVMSAVTESLAKNLMKTDNYNETVDTDDRHLSRSTLRRKNKLNNVIAEGIVSDEYETWLSAKRSNLEKLHFIIGHGILRPELKDEIYCQIVKQLINNPSKSSYAKGWVLLSLCIGCFAPTDKLINYLKSFIKTGPSEYASLCAKRLMRTYENGSRTQPPCWIEIESVKYKRKISLPITFANGNSKIVQADSASTSQEIVESLAASVNLKDTFGFSLFITIDDKVLSLGSEREHVMDAISQCEQYAAEQGHSERDERWRLLFRKEIFAPWHDPATDQVATNLIYHQICNSVKSGEYRFSNEIDLATNIAQQLYVHYHSKSLPKNLKHVLHTYVPNQLLQRDSKLTLLRLEELIVKIYNRKFGSITCVPSRIKEEVVLYAKNSWPILFSKFYEVNKLYGPDLNDNEVVIAVNCTGVFFIDENEQIILQISFPEIAEVNCQKNESTTLHNFTITTVQREEYRFQNYNAESFVSLVNHLINGLKRRSTYVVAIQDYTDGNYSIEKGDVIKLIDGCTGNSIIRSCEWAYGEKDNVKIRFPSEYVYVLPTLNKPSHKLLELFKSDFPSKVSNPVIQELNLNIREMKYHNLKKFANEHFSKSSKTFTTSTSGIISSSSSHDLWKHTREPIKAPLLAAIASNEEQSQRAVRIFKNILKYMGDLPSNKQRSCTDYTDEIFEPALKDPLLRDEVYCQIMRQLTLNKVRLSEERGWELMWLGTGIMSCGSLIRKELEQFLISRNNDMAQTCLNRFRRISNINLTRLSPPCRYEVEAVKFKNLQIFHKVYFPDGTDAAFEVHSSIRALELCEEISKKLQLRGFKSFSLYFKIDDRIISVPQNYFFFDFVREITSSVSKIKSDVSSETTYKVLFIRKIWIDCLPGRDRNADLKFHFYQEATKYLRGYCKCNVEDAITLASLIYISGHGSNNEELSQIHTKLHEYVPVDMISHMSAKKWKKYITLACDRYKNLSQNEARIKFLQHVYQWPTFGSSFFEVRQMTDPKLPERLCVAINKNGVSLIEPTSKDILAMYGFAELSNWSSGDTYFHMTIGNFLNGRKILCKTVLGYKIDDLISSYIDYLQAGSATYELDEMTSNTAL